MDKAISRRNLILGASGTAAGLVGRDVTGDTLAFIRRCAREDGGYARSAEEVSGPAVLNLLNRARGDLSAGRVEQAMASLETALEIEKRNPFIWQQLARAHLQRHSPEDAEIVAQRSNGFARGNPYIEIENWRLIAQARNVRGDRAGVEQARAKVTELQARIGDD